MSYNYKVGLGTIVTLSFHFFKTNCFPMKSNLQTHSMLVQRQSMFLKFNQKKYFTTMWPSINGENNMHGTTILSIRKGNKVVVIGDGQISQGNTIVKNTAIKVRRIENSSHQNNENAKKEEPLKKKKSSKQMNNSNVVLAGFAGGTADALTLLDRLERKLDQYPGQVLRSCVELAKLWRTDKYLRRLEAMLIVADKNVSLTLTGNGDVIQSEDGVIAIGSGGVYALSAARALLTVENVELDAEEIAKRSMKIANDMCVYTNNNFTMEVLDSSDQVEKKKK